MYQSIAAERVAAGRGPVACWLTRGRWAKGPLQGRLSAPVTARLAAWPMSRQCKAVGSISGVSVARAVSCLETRENMASISTLPLQLVRIRFDIAHCCRCFKIHRTQAENAETALALALSRSEPAQSRPRRRSCPPDRRCENSAAAASHASRDTSRDSGSDRQERVLPRDGHAALCRPALDPGASLSLSRLDQCGHARPS